MDAKTPQQAEIKRILRKLKSLEKEKAPAMVLDVGDAKILLDYIVGLEHWANDSQYSTAWVAWER